MAAGVSSRMKKALEEDSSVHIEPKLIEEANTLPKCMLSVGPNGTRFIDYILLNATRWGFGEIILLLNPKDAVTRPHVENFVRAMWLALRVHFAIQYIPEGRDKPWGTGDAVFQALEQFPLENGDVYSLSNSDNLCSQEVFERAFSAKENTMFSYDTWSLGIHPNDRSKYGLVMTDISSKCVSALIEKPSIEEIAKLEKQHVLSVNMNLLTLSYADTYDKLAHLLPHPVRNEKEVTEVFRELAVGGNLKSEIVFESIPDLTSKADIPKVQKYLAEAYPELQKRYQK